MYRKIWRTGPPGTTIELKLLRDAAVIRIDVVSGDRESLMKSPRAH